MNQKEPGTYFDEWLTAYSDHLHMVRQGAGVDLVQPTVPQPRLSRSAESSDTATMQRKPSA